MNNENKIKNNICKTIDTWLNKTQNQTSASFARLLNVSDTSVKRWRNGVCLPDVSLLPKICEIMDISLLTLFGLDNTNLLTQTEQKVIKELQTNPDFKSFIEKYLNDEDFRNLIKSIAKFQK